MAAVEHGLLICEIRSLSDSVRRDQREAESAPRIPKSAACDLVEFARGKN